MENFERGDEVRQRDSVVGVPFLECLDIVNKYEEVLVRSPVEDLGLLSFAASHCGSVRLVSWSSGD